MLVDNTERPISLNMKAHVIKKGTRIAQGVIASVVTAHLLRWTSYWLVNEVLADLNLRERSKHQNLNFIKKKEQRNL
ncbi:Deoxyuridine 5'-triphosphate nucleotidohydrolase [Bacillus thuringiensis serovar israelensis ATCC 35646]|nr:Deoxyuridine 5'-triphosphate nucleotidohydrolase [Bacillus thuringiensis serovar israelensis ATCC 35646]